MSLASPLVSDPQNTRVKEARRLARRAFRDSVGRFLVEGPQAVRELLTRPELLVEVFLTDAAAQRHPELVDGAIRTGARVTLATEDIVAGLSDTVTPQGIVAVASSLTVPLDAVLERSPRLLALLAYARDPGNAGTVIRCADAAGAEGVLLSQESVDVHNPKCVRASAGSVFHLPIAAGVPLPAAVSRAQQAGLIVLAADGAGDTDLDEATDAALLAGPVAWLFGNEAWGLPDEVLNLVDRVVRVPIHGRAESLNLATAAAVCLYATARAQRQPGGCRYPGAPGVAPRLGSTP